MAAPLRTHAAVRTPQRRPSGARQHPKPKLAVVPRRRRAAGVIAALSVLVGSVMFAAAFLHTRLAERQIRIDRLDQSVVEAQERFDVLRRQRAELRSPTRLSTEADRLGMRPADASQFVTIDPMTVAKAIAATGTSPTPERIIAGLEPLDQYRLVKSVGAGAP